MRAARFSKGFSLLSLMIATVIGMFIMGAAGKVYVDSKSTFNVRTAVSAATENGRFALSDMRRTLVMAGRGIPASQKAFPSVETGGIEDGGSDSDIVGVKYAFGSSCGGDISAITTIRFKVEDNTLTCEKGGTDFPLVSGVHLMRVLYGVNDTVDGFANRYLTASVVESENKWGNVVSLRIGLVVSSDNDELPASMRGSTEQTLDVLGQSYTVPDADHIYQVVSTTLSFRNLNTVVQRQ